MFQRSELHLSMSETFTVRRKVNCRRPLPRLRHRGFLVFRERSKISLRLEEEKGLRNSLIFQSTDRLRLKVQGNSDCHTRHGELFFKSLGIRVQSPEQ